ncbi:MAG: DUF928 domain-containing protein [Microcystaceae cyanobacterium]
MKPIAYLYLLFNLLLSYPPTLFAQTPTSQPSPKPSPNSESLPSVAKDPPPNNKTRPGGGLSQEPNTCQAKEGQLTALIPERNNPHPPLTLADSFTLLLYFPDDISQIEEVKFWINSEDEKVRIYPKQSIALSNSAGIVSLTFRKNLENILEVGNNYHWFIKISCQNKTSIALNGWFQVVDNSQKNRWHNLLYNLAKQRSQNPNDPAIQLEWERFLEQIDAANLANKPIYFIDFNTQDSETENRE